MELSTNPAAVRAREYRKAHLAEVRAYERKYVEANREKLNEYSRSVWHNNKERRREIIYRSRKKHHDSYLRRSREYYAKHREERLAQSKASRIKHAEEIKAKAKAKYWKNRQTLLEKNREWRLANPDKLRATQTRYILDRRKRDIVYRLRATLSGRIREALKKGFSEKNNRTEELLGCSVAFFRGFIEHQFTPEMTWDNYGSYWHIDHVIPVKQFDLRDVAEQKKAFHYSNCRPLEAKKNIAKSDNLPGPHQPLLL